MPSSDPLAAVARGHLRRYRHRQSAHRFTYLDSRPSAAAPSQNIVQRGQAIQRMVGFMSVVVGQQAGALPQPQLEDPHDQRPWTTMMPALRPASPQRRERSVRRIEAATPGAGPSTESPPRGAFPTAIPVVRRHRHRPSLSSSLMTNPEPAHSSISTSSRLTQPSTPACGHAGRIGFAARSRRDSVVRLVLPGRAVAGGPTGRVAGAVLQLRRNRRLAGACRPCRGRSGGALPIPARACWPRRGSSRLLLAITRSMVLHCPWLPGSPSSRWRLRRRAQTHAADRSTGGRSGTGLLHERGALECAARRAGLLVQPRPESLARRHTAVLPGGLPGHNRRRRTGRHVHRSSGAFTAGQSRGGDIRTTGGGLD